MRYLSVCSGIEAATVAWHPLGWKPAAFSEIEAFPRAVLQHHYPDVPLHGDFTTIGADDYGAIDLLVGGTPCQSFSVAGLRKGLADERGNLALEYLRLADRTRPEWLVWENVPGVLSSNGGKDFGAFLGGLAELGYGFAYAVLDAQHFGVPQRRRRVFVVGHLGDWRRAAAVLFERHSLSGDSPPRREKGQNAPTIPSRSTAGGGLGTDFDCDGGLVQQAYSIMPMNSGKDYKARKTDVAQPLMAGGPVGGNQGGDYIATAYQTSGNCGAWETGQVTGALDTNTDPNSVVIGFGCKEYAQDATVDISPPLRAGGHDGSHANGGVMPAVAFDWNNSAGAPNSEDTFGTLSTERSMAAMLGSAVRRLTPRECERLQGFPDDYTLIPYRGKPAADGPRYKALGNSMAVPVMRWIGERIALVDATGQQRAAA